MPDRHASERHTGAPPGNDGLVDKAEATSILGEQEAALRRVPYDALIQQYLNQPAGFEVTGASGRRYQVEVEAFWDSGEPGDLRVLVAIDDGGLRAFAPMTTGFIVASDGSFVGE